MPDTLSAADLPPGTAEWLAPLGPESITRVERAVVRREAWLVDVTRGDGTVLELFVRVGREGDPANEPAGLHHEARVVQALADTQVPVAAVHGVHDRLHVVAYARAPGDSDLVALPDHRQQAVYEHYVQVLGELHRLEPEALGLGDLPRPASPEACAIDPLASVEAAFADNPPEPLCSFASSWIRRHAPRSVPRVALLHGDAGTTNFVFGDDDRVRAAVDWEWAHLGDPMEDLGSLATHATFFPTGDLPALWAHYEKASGLPVDRDAVRYYRAHLFTRAVIALLAHVVRLDPRNPVALNLSYKVINDRLCCESIAECLGLELEVPDLPEPDDRATTLFDVVVHNLADDVVPAVQGSFARDRAESALMLVQTLARLDVLGPIVDAAECDELSTLLGHRVGTADGLVELDRRIRAGQAPPDDIVLRYLARRAYRAEALYQPVVALFPERRLRPIG